MCHSTSNRGDRRSTPRAIFVALWLALSVLAGVGATELTAMFSGIGYAHLRWPSLITVVLLNLWAAVIGIGAVAAWRGWLGYSTGFLVGLVLWLPAFYTSVSTLEAHYTRVCDHDNAPKACNAVTDEPEECREADDDSCRRRTVRACQLGHVRACDRAVERDWMAPAQMCAALEDKCRQARACSHTDDPRRCFGPDTPRTEELRVYEICPEYTERCEP